MPILSWHDYLTCFSSIAAIAGLLLLCTEKPINEDDLEVADRVLCMMIFAYWLVYCAAATALKFVQPEWEIVLLSVRITGVLSYLLTATCILSLPLHRVATRQTEKG